MSLDDILVVPDPVAPVIAWDTLHARFPWVAAMHGCPQDAVHHPEGDVAAHVRLCLEALVALPAWRQADPHTRLVLWAATLLHDAGKPATTREEHGRITSPGHARAGALLARRVLWELGADLETREAVTGLVRWHMRPNFLLEAADPRRELFRVSMTARWDHLLVLATADASGRGTAIPPEKAELFGLLHEYAREEACLAGPRAFANARSRVLYFAREDRDPAYAAHDETWGEVLLMVGLPGSGKTTWLRRQHPALPVVSRDELRRQRGLASGEDEALVSHAALDQAQGYLRARQPFAWDATHLVRDLRAPALALIHRYGARVCAVQFEVDPTTQRVRNVGRPDGQVVPASAMERILSRWEVPDLTEVDAIDLVTPATPEHRDRRMT